jgi:hypothetical protein
MTDPTPAEQLLNLADRAQRHGGLTEAEAARLREGISALTAERDWWKTAFHASRDYEDKRTRERDQFQRERNEQQQRAEKAEAERDRLAAELDALRHPELFSGTVNDIGDLYAIHQAITDSGGTLSRPVHRALDALRTRWDLSLRHEQERARRAALDEQQEH